MEQAPPLSFGERAFNALRPSATWTFLVAFLVAQGRRSGGAVLFFLALGFAFALALWVGGLLRERRGVPRLGAGGSLLAGACGVLGALILVAQVRYAIAAINSGGDTEDSLAALVGFMSTLSGVGGPGGGLLPASLPDALLFVSSGIVLLALLVRGGGDPMAQRSRHLLAASLICGLVLVGCQTQVGRQFGVALPVAVLPLLTLSALVFQRLEEGYQESVATLRRRQAYGLDVV
ncbi:MAG TPA: hypothetical protein DEA08_00150 [Planctomycetes bacterium]|nr:hypothetical protein [Planctomycetota bacterium]